MNMEVILKSAMYVAYIGDEMYLFYGYGSTYWCIATVDQKLFSRCAIFLYPLKT